MKAESARSEFQSKIVESEFQSKIVESEELIDYLNTKVAHAEKSMTKMNNKLDPLAMERRNSSG